MPYVKYTTTSGDSYTDIAQSAYGDAYAFTQIIDANPHAPIHDSLAQGIVLFIPVIDPPQTDIQTTAATPPWKR